MAISDTKYGVHQRLAALDNALTDQARVLKALRAEFAQLRSEHDVLKEAFKTSSDKSGEYIAFLQQRVAARIAAHQK